MKRSAAVLGNADGTGENQPPRKSRRLAGKALAPPKLLSLIVTWKPDKQTANETGFHVLTTATLDRDSLADLKILQYVCDGLSIGAGTDPGNLQYYMTTFIEDRDESGRNNLRSCAYDDKPGYTSDHGLAGDTDLKYVFGAKWKVTLGGTTLTETTPLYGVVTGAHPRTYTPGAKVRATWNPDTRTWSGKGALLTVFPAWGTYPTPPVDNA